MPSKDMARLTALVDKDVYFDLKQMAVRENLSMNKFILKLLQAGLDNLYPDEPKGV